MTQMMMSLNQRRLHLKSQQQLRNQQLKNHQQRKPSGILITAITATLIWMMSLSERKLEGDRRKQLTTVGVTVMGPTAIFNS